MSKTMTSDEYVGKLGLRCPHCKSENICAGEINADSGSLVQQVSCDDCGAEWLDAYQLIGYEKLVT
jgi:predicted Zn-ribbon and HTH transcriptional regulator